MLFKKEHKVYSFNPAALTSIFFGCKTDDIMIEEVKQVVRDNEYLRHVKFFIKLSWIVMLLNSILKNWISIFTIGVDSVICLVPNYV